MSNLKVGTVFFPKYLLALFFKKPQSNLMRIIFEKVRYPHRQKKKKLRKKKKRNMKLDYTSLSAKSKISS